ncbi:MULTISPECIES: flagellar export chaperone FliS [unclassified Variovorax]|uniref:flagellar export chaperone FliS n=1 Tax=unclassified Variovorax TaxID=663243 RepID=UPI002574EE1D|nr:MULTISPECIES: flagellar export chaperone FliS [unclassified Variovorax]MDM0089785.1 flagellar export chaperone FliS [Variovorax sp. J22G40]MDM0148549.1 flagellar export chaperone FliS [Variovorax sp. J2P1-31]
MYTPPHLRAASAYKTVGAQSSVDGADAHQLIVLVFDGLLQAVNAARGALTRGEVALKGEQIQRAVRLLEEGLKGGLDMARGGELARQLRALYDYCIERLTQANLRNDGEALAEVVRLVTPVAEGWKEMGRLRSVQPA